MFALIASRCFWKFSLMRNSGSVGIQPLICTRRDKSVENRLCEASPYFLSQSRTFWAVSGLVRLAASLLAQQCQRFAPTWYSPLRWASSFSFRGVLTFPAMIDAAAASWLLAVTSPLANLALGTGLVILARKACGLFMSFGSRTMNGVVESSAAIFVIIFDV